MKKRIFSIFCVLCLVFTMLPATAWAADSVTYLTWSEEQGKLVTDTCDSYISLTSSSNISSLMSTEQTPVFFAAPKYPAMLSKLAKGRTESYGDSARGPTWQSHEQRFPAALQ